MRKLGKETAAAMREASSRRAQRTLEFEQAVLRCHRRGLCPTEIARQLSRHPTACADVIRKAGLVPHRGTR